MRRSVFVKKNSIESTTSFAADKGGELKQVGSFEYRVSFNQQELDADADDDDHHDKREPPFSSLSLVVNFVGLSRPVQVAGNKCCCVCSTLRGLKVVLDGQPWPSSPGQARKLGRQASKLIIVASHEHLG